MDRMKNLCITLIVASTLLTGCGGNLFEGMTDDNTEAAKMEAAKIALDKGDYTEAVNLLEELCGTDTANLTCDDAAKADLASAYVATATGLDVLQLIAAAEEAAADPASSFTTVSTLLPIEDINTCAEDPAACTLTEDMDNAVAILEGLLEGSDPSDPNLTDVEKNLYLQLAVASSVNVAVNIGIVSDGLNDDGTPKVVPSDVDASTLEDISDDINNIVDGVQGSGLFDTSLTDDINNIESTLDEDDDGSVSLSELQSYITDVQ